MFTSVDIADLGREIIIFKDDIYLRSILCCKTFLLIIPHNNSESPTNIRLRSFCLKYITRINIRAKLYGVGMKAFIVAFCVQRSVTFFKEREHSSGGGRAGSSCVESDESVTVTSVNSWSKHGRRPHLLGVLALDMTRSRFGRASTFSLCLSWYLRFRCKTFLFSVYFMQIFLCLLFYRFH